MPKSYEDVALDYDAFKKRHPDNPLGLGEYAQQMDQAQGTPGERSSAYVESRLKNLNVGIDKLMNLTGLPQGIGQFASGVGELVDSAMGTHIAPTMKSLGEGTPRMLAEGALTALAPETLPLRLAQLGGYGSAALRGYTDTDSPVGAAISAGTLGAYNKLVPVAGDVGSGLVNKWLGQAAPEAGELAYKTVGERVAPMLGNFAGAGAATAGINELSRQAEMSVGPNGVPLTDFKDRNPFTQENIAGDIASILPHAVQIGASVHGQLKESGFDVDNINNFLAKPVESLPMEASIGEVPTPKDFSSAIIEGSPIDKVQNSQLMHTTLKSLLDTAGDLEKRAVAGDPQAAIEAQKTRESAVGLFRLMSSDESVATPEQLKSNAEQLDSLARENPPQDVVGFQKMLQGINSHIDLLNENTNSFNEQQKLASTKGETWHPNARDPSVIERLQKKDLIPKVTPEWLAKEFNATFDTSGNPDFAYQVVLQKATNKILDAVPAALVAEKALPTQVETPVSPKVQEVNQQEHNFIKALTSLPDSIKDAAIQKTVEIARADNRGQKPMPYGRVTGQTASWQKAVMQAAQSYDPASQTILLKKGGKFVRVPANDLLTFEPYSSPVPRGAGGKSSVELTNLEGRVQGGDNLNVPTPEELADETGFSKKLAEEGVPGIDIPSTTGEGIAKPEADLGKGAEEVVPDKGISDQLTKQAGKLSKVVDSLTDDQLFQIAGKSFEQRSPSGALVKGPSWRKTEMRTILKAALENYGKSGEPGLAGQEFLRSLEARGKKLGDFTPKKQLDLALRDWFGKDYNTPTGKLAQVVNRLLDDKNVQLVKGNSLAREGDTLVEYSAPVRLRRWLEKPTGGLTPDAKGELPTKSVPALLTKLGIGKDEMALYKSLGLDDFLSRQKVGAKELADWMDKHTPQIAVKKSQYGKIDNEAKKAGDKALHQLETLGYQVEDGDEYFGVQWAKDGETVYKEHVPDNVRSLMEIVENMPDEHADVLETQWHDISSKEIDDKSGYVEIAVHLPNAPEFAGSQHGFPTNTIAHVRGRTELLPSGEKVFLLDEVQGDAAQRMAALKERAKTVQPMSEKDRIARDELLKKDHPLLAVYEQLALKAAIAHAREIGAKYVALSDAETAMMTEGHDRQYTAGYGNSVLYPTKEAALKGAESWKYSLTNQHEIYKPEYKPYLVEKNGGYEFQFRNHESRIAQEPGMRAAYDVRLPDTMSKLTGEKGKVVDFGQHKAVGHGGDGVNSETGEVYGSPVFNNKTNVTAHLYDISRAPEKFSAFGYSLPKYGSTMVEGTPSLDPGAREDLLTNHPAPGQFANDVASSIATYVNKLIGEKGLSGTFRKLYVEASRVVAEKYGQVIPVDFYNLKEPGVAGRASIENGRGKIGINLDTHQVFEGNEHKAIREILGTITHELAHIDDFVHRGLIDAPDAYSFERTRQMNNMKSMSDVMTEEQRHGILTTIRQSLYPKEYEQLVSRQDRPDLVYGSQSTEEFIAEVTRMTADSLQYAKNRKVKNINEVLDYLPVEVNEFMHGTYRSIYDIMDAAKQTIEHPSIRTQLGKERIVPTGTDPRVLAHAFGAILTAAKEGSLLSPNHEMVQQTRATNASLLAPAALNPPVFTKSTWIRANKNISENFAATHTIDSLAMPRATEAIEAAHEVFVPKERLKINQGPWMKWFALFSQQMTDMERQGVPLAGPIRILADNLQTGVTRFRSKILAPMLKTGDDGKISLAQHSPLVEWMNSNKTGIGRDTLNILRDFQQRNGAQSMFVVDPKTKEVVVNGEMKGAQAKWDSVKGRLSREDQQKLMGAMVAKDQIGQLGGTYLTAAIDSTNRMHTAGLIMAMNPKMTYDQAKGIADQVVGGMMMQDPKVASLLSPEQMTQVQTFLGGDDGVLAKFDQVKNLLLNRPGYSTETLNGDHIVQFINPEGETKYLSSDTNHKAKLLAKQLEKEGNKIVGDIMTKEELRDFTDFDDNDMLLQKFTEVETKAWNKVQAGFEQLYGPESAEALKVYSPGAASLKEMSLRGMDKYTQERKSKVDSSRYDYVDGMMSWVNRLSTSLTYKTTTLEKNLILSDPRAKMFPEFGKIVNTHFDNMMAPTSDFTRQMKTMAGAYMMGGSVASAAINGTQSIVSLVPVLIRLSKQGMGPSGAYALMGKAFGKVVEFGTGSDWQRVAKAAEGVDPQNWSRDQAIAALYKRNVSDGGITQGVIQGDILSGTDQNTLFNAQFGHGKYSQVTKGDMAKNGAYLAAQLSLKPFGWIESFNHRISLFTGIMQGYDQGLRGEALYDYARQIKTLSTYGGGKANAPGFVAKASTPFTRSAIAIATTMQSYGFGMVTEYASAVKEMINSKGNLSPADRRQALKSFGTMFMTQVAIGGALGLPFAAASLTMLEKVFGIQANAAVRQGLASLGQDDEQGSVIAETALNGLGNQMFGLDLSSRVGVSNLLGTSTYRGFNVADLVGPMGSIVGNAVKALNLFGQNEPGQAMTALVPTAFKNIMTMADSQAKYGDSNLRDQSGNLLYSPSPSQAAAYMIGFRPRELSQRQSAQSLLTLADQQATAQHNRVQQSAAQSLLAGDPSPARSLAYGARDGDYTMRPQDIYNQILNKAVDSSIEKDLLASGPSYNEQERRQIASTYQPDIVERQSEIQRTLLKAQLAARVGAPGLMPDGQAYRKAAVIDSLVKSSGMPRSQASRLVEFLKL